MASFYFSPMYNWKRTLYFATERQRIKKCRSHVLWREYSESKSYIIVHEFIHSWCHVTRRSLGMVWEILSGKCLSNLVFVHAQICISSNCIFTNYKIKVGSFYSTEYLRNRACIKNFSNYIKRRKALGHLTINQTAYMVMHAVVRMSVKAYFKVVNQSNLE